MSSNRVTLSILPDTADTQTDMVLDDCIHVAVNTTEAADGNTERHLEEVVKDSPMNQDGSKDCSTRLRPDKVHGG